MFAPANQPYFSLALDDDQHELKVLEFTGTEAISQPYRFDLELVSERPDIALESLLHRQAFLSFDTQGAGIHGQIYRVGQGETSKHLTRYQISLVPHLAYLDQRINQRIFQHKNVPEIIEQILKDHGILGDTFKFELGSQYLEREYCVQYAESDLAFIQRLCSELGIHYHFQHSAERHLLVFGDDQTFFPRLAEPTPYRPGSAMAVAEPTIKHFNVRLETRATAVTRRDYDFLKPRLKLEGRVDNKQLPGLEDYHFPGQFSDREYGKQLAQRALERHAADHRQAEGHSDQPALITGHFLSIEEHPRQQWNDLWLITRIEHRGRQPQVLEGLAASSGEDDFQGYCNTFLATPWNVIFRPPLIEKPHVRGYQSAVVTGPRDSEIHCDEHGRVKVQLAWDREGEGTDRSSCWLRVASSWAHDGYGAALIPRVGMEVLVGFVDADADKPLIMGCLSNGANSSALDLPADKTRSVLRSQSTPASPDGARGYNELRIEDRRGAEEIYLRAQRDWTQLVRHDLNVQVDNHRSVVVGGVDRNETRGNRWAELKQNDHLHVSGDRHISVNNQALNASQQFHVSAGVQVVIDGGGSATIQAGGNWINIGPGGIFSSVPIKSGGAPVKAMTATVGAPDKPVVPLALLSFAQVLSLKSAAPFCEECERCKAGLCAV